MKRVRTTLGEIVEKIRANYISEPSKLEDRYGKPLKIAAKIVLGGITGLMLLGVLGYFLGNKHKEHPLPKEPTPKVIVERPEPKPLLEEEKPKQVYEPEPSVEEKRPEVRVELVDPISSYEKRLEKITENGITLNERKELDGLLSEACKDMAGRFEESHQRFREKVLGVGRNYDERVAKEKAKKEAEERARKISEAEQLYDKYQQDYLSLAKDGITAEERASLDELLANIGVLIEQYNELAVSKDRAGLVLSLRTNVQKVAKAHDVEQRKIREIDETIESLKEQIKQNPEQELLYLDLSRAYIERRERALALKTLEEGIMKRPLASKPLQMMYIQTISSVEELKQGCKFLENLRTEQKLPDLEFTIGNLYVSLGRKFVESGNLDEAIQSFESAIDLNEKWAVPYCELGELLMQKGKQDAAYSNFRKANELDRNWSRPLFNIARAHEKNGKVFCRNYYEKAIALDPSNKAQSEYIQCILNANLLKSPGKQFLQPTPRVFGRYAKKFFVSMVQKYPKERRLKLSLAQVYMILDEWDNAITILETENSRSQLEHSFEGPNEDDELIALNLGRCYKAKNLTERAKREFNRASKINPNSAARNELEIIAQHELSLRQWSKLDPEKKKEQEHLDCDRAIELCRNGEWHSAFCLLEKYGGSGSSYMSALLGLIHMEVGNFDKAKKEFERAESLEKGRGIKFLKSFEKNVVRAFLQREKDIYSITTNEDRESTEINRILFELYREASQILPGNKTILYKKSKFAEKSGEIYEDKGELEKAKGELKHKDKEDSLDLEVEQELLEKPQTIVPEDKSDSDGFGYFLLTGGGGGEAGAGSVGGEAYFLLKNTPFALGFGTSLINFGSPWEKNLDYSWGYEAEIYASAGISLKKRLALVGTIGFSSREVDGPFSSDSDAYEEYFPWSAQLRYVHKKLVIGAGYHSRRGLVAGIGFVIEPQKL